MKKLSVTTIPAASLDATETNASTPSTKSSYRTPRAQVTDKFARWMEESEMKKQPSSPVGEYLGDIEITDEMLSSLNNINPFVNSIGRVERGTYILWADLDYCGDGHFIGLRLEPLRDADYDELSEITDMDHDELSRLVSELSGDEAAPKLSIVAGAGKVTGGAQ